MSDIPETVRPDVVPASVQHLDGLLGPLAAYLRAVEARVAALERRLCAVPLMTAADAACYTRVDVKTILRAVRSGELPFVLHLEPHVPAGRLQLGAPRSDSGPARSGTRVICWSCRGCPWP